MAPAGVLSIDPRIDIRKNTLFGIQCKKKKYEKNYEKNIYRPCGGGFCCHGLQERDRVQDCHPGCKDSPRQLKSPH